MDIYNQRRVVRQRIADVKVVEMISANRFPPKLRSVALPVSILNKPKAEEKERLLEDPAEQSEELCATYAELFHSRGDPEGLEDL